MMLLENTEIGLKMTILNYLGYFHMCQRIKLLGKTQNHNTNILATTVKSLIK